MKWSWGISLVLCPFLGQGLQVISPTNVLGDNIRSTHFSRYFGKQSCEPVQGTVVSLEGSDAKGLCKEPVFVGNYSGMILLLPELFYPIEELEVESLGIVVPVHNRGCSREFIFEKVVASGAIGAISFTVDSELGFSEYVRGYGKHDENVYDKIILLVVSLRDWLRISQVNNTTLSLPCGEPNPSLNYIDAVSWMSLLFGVLDLGLGLYGILGAYKIRLSASFGNFVSKSRSCFRSKPLRKQSESGITLTKVEVDTEADLGNQTSLRYLRDVEKNIEAQEEDDCDAENHKVEAVDAIDQERRVSVNRQDEKEEVQRIPSVDCVDTRFTIISTEDSTNTPNSCRTPSLDQQDSRLQLKRYQSSGLYSSSGQRILRHHQSSGFGSCRSFRGSSLGSRRASSFSSVDSVGSNRPLKKKVVVGQKELLIIICAVEIVLGIMRILAGGNIYSHSYVLGDALAAYPLKSMLTTGFAGLKFFTTVLLSFFWLEMRNAMKELRSVENVLIKKRRELIIAFVLVVVPDTIFCILGAMFLRETAEIGMWIYSISTALTALWFMYSVHSLLKLLGDHISNMDRGGDGTTNGMSDVKRFVLHLAKWLRFFSLSSFLTVVLIVMYLPTDFVYTSPDAFLSFFVILFTLSWFSMFTKIQGLLGPDFRKSRRNSTQAAISKPNRNADVNELEPPKEVSEKSEMSQNSDNSVIVVA